MAASALCGCFLKKDLPLDGPVIESVRVVGGASIDRGELLRGLATHESPTFLFMRGVAYDYEVLDQALLERDLERVERFYRARGFYQARVTGARVIWSDTHAVRVLILVEEGPPLLIPSTSATEMAVQLAGLEQVGDATTIAQLIARSPRPGTRFDEAEYEAAKSDMRSILANSGYAFATVSGSARADLTTHEARLRFEINAGYKATFGDIAIEGLDRIPEDVIRKNLLLNRGDPYSAERLEDARRALVNLGVFTSVRVQADTTSPATRRVPVQFVVQEAAPRAIRLGVGTRLDAIQLSANLTGRWEHKNFLGGLRQLAVEIRPGLVFFPTRLSRLEDFQAPDRALFEGSVSVQLSQPSFLEGRTRGVVGSSLAVHPLLYLDTVSNKPLSGFLELTSRAGLERAFFSHRLYVTPSLNWQAAIPVDYAGLSFGATSPEVSTDSLENLLISYPELVVRLDLRDDPIDTTNGLVLSNSLQLATPALGGDLSDLRVNPEARFYVTKTNMTLALRATTGLLFPSNYARRPDATDPQSSVEQQKLLFRGFFSGGAFSNRGYAFQGVGKHQELILSRDPTVRCGGGSTMVPQACQRPLGGLTLWEMSVELRFNWNWFSPLGVVLFVDASDVRSGRADYRFGNPHLSPGLGLRYPTPVGPIRLDIGLRVLDLLKKSQAEGSPPKLLGAPMALHLAVGQAF